MKEKLLLSCLLLISVMGYGQKWADMMNDPDVNFYDVQREAELYFETHDKGKGSGWKQYERWKYNIQFQVDEDGNRYDPRIIWEETENFLEQHSAERSASAVANWTELGPKTWSATSGWNPGIGRIRKIAVNPANQSVIYIASDGGGVWKTTNGGSTWAVLTDDWPVLETYSVAMDPTNSNIIYVGTKAGGVLKSTNGGSSWSVATSGIPTTATIKQILINPSNNSIVLAATTSGIYRSTNGGSSWVLTRSGS
ncbi:MAG: glycosyl hydrolase, partial [Bacteroidetes bacterium]|nr:glycosyl hydrolase [Bacteroidota bacterium]